MRVLLASKFLHHVGGVETYLAWQARALTAAGHEVALLGMQAPDGAAPLDLPEVPTWHTPLREYTSGASGRARSALSSIYSPAVGAVMGRAVEEFRPDVVHYHGTCYQLTPAVVTAAVRHRVPTFFTAHEYKAICVNQTLFDDRRGEICTDCVGAGSVRKLVAPVRRACMKGSHAVSAIGAVEGQVASRVWRAADPQVLTPSRFMRSLLLRDGWPADRVRHLDLPWQPAEPVAATDRDSILFLGRLFPEKGAHLLIRAWALIAQRHPDVQLRIAGDGDQRPELERLVADESVPRTTFLGFIPKARAAQELARSLVTAHPAIWFENSPFSVRESLLAGVPAAVADHGGMPELVGPESGYVVARDTPDAWAEALDLALTERRAGTDDLRADVEGRATSERDHLDVLVGLYAAESGVTAVGAG